MVWLANLERDNLVFTLGLFGIQHDEWTDSKRQTILRLYTLLSSSADWVDHLQDESHGTPRTVERTTTLVAYWLKREDYQKWKESPAVVDFWNSLPDDAGVWREILTVPKSRYKFAANLYEPRGLASLLGLVQSTDEGYWGVYRHRLSANPDQYTSPDDKFTSPLVTKAKARPDSTQPVVDLESPRPNKVRLGRVKMQNLPDNLVFVREGQRQPRQSTEETETWLTKLEPYARSWMDHLNTARNKNGTVTFDMYVAQEKPKPVEQSETQPVEPAAAAADPGLDAKPIPETNQLMYFLDLAHFELAGRSFKGHITLRNNTFEAYGPGGKHETGPTLSLFVELAVLKSTDIDAEYIGCRDGTGLMVLEGL